jgi:hypothetical protein
MHNKSWRIIMLWCGVCHVLRTASRWTYKELITRSTKSFGFSSNNDYPLRFFQICWHNRKSESVCNWRFGWECGQIRFVFDSINGRWSWECFQRSRSRLNSVIIRAQNNLLPADYESHQSMRLTFLISFL